MRLQDRCQLTGLIIALITVLLLENHGKRSFEVNRSLSKALNGHENEEKFGNWGIGTKISR